MKKLFIILIVFSAFFYTGTVSAQCSICSKNAMQMGSKPASGLNKGILFLMALPFACVGVVGYKWYKSTR